MKTLLLILALAGSHAADSYTTERNLYGAPGGRELNPVMRPFSYPKPWFVTSQVGGFAGVVVIEELVRRKGGRRKGHPKVADAIVAVDAGGHLAAAWYNATRKAQKASITGGDHVTTSQTR